MRILMFLLVLLAFPAGEALAHGSGCGDGGCGYSASCGDGHHGCGWTAHRRWFRRSHRHSHRHGHWSRHGHGHGHESGHGHGHGHGCCDDEYRAAGAPGFPPHPRDGQEVIVDGHQWEYDADDHRWERD